MNTTEARFLRIKRFSEDEVAALHRDEREEDARWRATVNVLPLKARGDGWRVLGAKKIASLEVGKPAFWNPRQMEDERARAIDQFLKSSPVRRAFALLEDAEKTEVVAQHAADWVVWRLAPAIGVSVGDDLRQKAAA